MRLISYDDAMKIYEEHKSEFDSKLAKLQLSKQMSGTNPDVVDVIFSKAYTKEIITDSIRCHSAYTADEDDIVSRSLLSLSGIIDDHISFLEIYNHPKFNISAELCSALNNFYRPVFTEYEASEIYEANKSKWSGEITKILNTVCNLVHEDDWDILRYETDQCAIYSIMYGSKEIHPLENIKRELPYYLHCTVRYKHIDGQIEKLIDEAME